MKLVVCFGDDDFFSFKNGEVHITIRDLRNLKNVINNMELRDEFIDRERLLLNNGYDDDIADRICEVRCMPRFEDFNDFKSIRICLNKSVNIDDACNFLKGFPYKVIIDTHDIELDGVYKICSKQYAVQPLIKNEYNTESMSASEVKRSLEVVFDFAKKLNDGKLSPLEKLMFLYDYLKTRIYKEDEDYSNSASLSKVTLGDSIVCLGYANLFSAIANLIGIPTDVKIYGSNLDKSGGHATVTSYINDDKYNFHSILEFDPTWDAKKSENDTRYISKYYWFGLAPLFSEECKKSCNLTALGEGKSGGKLFKYFYNCTNLLKAGDDAGVRLNKRFFSTLFEKVEEEFSKLGYVPGLFLLQDIASKDSITKHDIDLLHYTYLKLYENNLGYDEFLRLLYFVRRSEFVFNDNYQLDFDDVVSISRKRETRNNLLAYVLFKDRDEYKNIASLWEFRSVPKDEKNKLEYDKKRLELVKTLNGVVERNK